MAYLIGHYKIILRIFGLVLYALSLPVPHHLYPIAAKAYDELCSSQGMVFVDAPPSFAQDVITIVILAVPLVFARSTVVVATNAIFALVTASMAAHLFKTAGNTPYECFTINGWYQDRTSGLDDFEWWILSAGVFSCILLLADWSIWLVRKPMMFKANAPAEP